MNQFVLDNLSTAVLVLDDTLSVQYINAAAEDLLKCSLQKTLSKKINHVFDLEGDWQAEIKNTLSDNARFTLRQVAIYLNHSQSSITVDYTVSAFINDDGSSCALIEMQALDRLLRISREEALLSSEQTSRTLIRGLAHEIKNPLAGIRGAAQLLSRLPSNKLKKTELEDYTQVIMNEADRLRNLVDRLLGTNKPLQLADLNIHEVLEHVCALIKVETNNEITLVRDYDPSVPEISGDKEQLIQVLLNILRNALQAQAGQISLKTRAQHHFTIGQQKHRMVCRIDIIDNGNGIPADLIENIFYPMITGRPEGTGLGLAIAQSIIIQHKGLIECTSKPGETLFSLYLPLVS